MKTEIIADYNKLTQVSGMREGQKLCKQCTNCQKVVESVFNQQSQSEQPPIKFMIEEEQGQDPKSSTNISNKDRCFSLFSQTLGTINKKCNKMNRQKIIQATFDLIINVSLAVLLGLIILEILSNYHRDLFSFQVSIGERPTYSFRLTKLDQILEVFQLCKKSESQHSDIRHICSPNAEYHHQIAYLKLSLCILALFAQKMSKTDQKKQSIIQVPSQQLSSKVQHLNSEINKRPCNSLFQGNIDQLRTIDVIDQGNELHQQIRKVSESDKSNMAILGGDSFKEKGLDRVDTIVNIKESDSQVVQESEPPIKLMNLRLPSRRDYSDSQTNQLTTPQNTLQIPQNRKHTSFKGNLVGNNRQNSSSTQIRPCFIPSLNHTQGFQFRAFRAQMFQQQYNDSAQSSDPNLTRVHQGSQLSPYSKFDRTKQQRFIPQKGGILVDRKTNDMTAQMALSSEIEKQSHSDYSVSREGSNNRLNDSMQITIQSLDANNGTQAIKKNDGTRKLDSGKSLFFQNHAKMAAHNQPMGSVSSHQVPFNLTRCVAAPGASSSGGYCPSDIQNNQRVASNLTGGPIPFSRTIEHKHEVYKSQQHLVSKKISKMTNSQIYAGVGPIDQYRKRIAKLEKQLNNTKIFLNMVIHDMRNPTNSIEHAIKEVINLINTATQEYHNNKIVPQSPNFYGLQRQNNNEKTGSSNTCRNAMIGFVSPHTQSQELHLNRVPMMKYLNQTNESLLNNAEKLITFQQKTVVGHQQSFKSQKLNKNGHLEQVIEEEIFQESHEEEKMPDELMLQSLRSSIHEIEEMIPSSGALRPPQQLNFKGGNKTQFLDQGEQLRKSYTKLNRQSANERSEQRQSNQLDLSQQIDQIRENFGLALQLNECSIEKIESSLDELPDERDFQSTVVHHIHNLQSKPSLLNSAIPIASSLPQVKIVRRIFIEEVTQEIFETQINQLQINNPDIQNSASNIAIAGQNIQTNFESREKIEIPTINGQQTTSQTPQAFPMQNIMYRSRNTEEAGNPLSIVGVQGSQQEASVSGLRNNEDRRSSLHGTEKRTESRVNNEEHKNAIGGAALANSVSINQSLGMHSGSKHESIQNGLNKNQNQLCIEEEKKEHFLQSSINENPTFHQRSRFSSNNRKNNTPIESSCSSQKGLQNNQALKSIETFSLQNQNQAAPLLLSPGAQNGAFRSPVFNIIAKPSMGCLQYQNTLTKGVILSQEEKKQCESLLKNSLFSSTMLLNLINDLLDLAKIENQAFNLHTTDFNLHEVIQKALDTLEFSAQQKTIDMQYVYDEEHAGFFMAIAGDDNRYLQILLNFLSNALKFTPAHGTIKVEVRLIDTQTKSNKDSAEDQKKLQRLTRQKTIIGGKDLGDQKVQRPRSNDQLDKKTEFKRKTTVIEGGNQTPKSNGGSYVFSGQNSKATPSNQIDGSQLKDDIQEALKKSKQPIEKYIKFELRIQDSGYGISPENQKKLFMNFSRLEEHAGQNKTGTGLGLSICKSLIELMGGTVSVESELGKGTCFIMQLQTKCKYPKSKEINQWLENFKGQGTNSQHRSSYRALGNGIQINIEELKQVDNRSQASKQQKFSPKYKYSCEDQGQPESILSYKNQGISNINSQKQSHKLQIPTGKNKKGISSSVKPDKRNIPIILVERESSSDDHFINLPQNSDAAVTFQQEKPYEAFPTGNFCWLQPQQQQDGGNHQMIMQSNGIPLMMHSAKQVPYYFSGNLLTEMGAPDDPYDMLQNQDPFAVNNYMNFQQVQLSDKRSARFFKALIANDDSFQLQIIGMIMKKCGFIVEEAENGLVALQKFQLAKDSYDVVILDLDMPIMNGYDACKRIRKNVKKESIRELLGFGSPANSKRLTQFGYKVGLPVVETVEFHDDEANQQRVFIVALSGLITDSVIERGLKYGFDEFIEAPLTEAKVREKILTRLLNKEFFACKEVSDEEEQLVDDSENMSRVSPYMRNTQNASTPMNQRQSKRRGSSRAVLIRKGTILQNQPFSAVDEEQSNFQEGENEDAFSMNRSVIDPLANSQKIQNNLQQQFIDYHDNQERQQISIQVMSGLNQNSGIANYSSK